ncbi:chitosanase [Peterkaempfera bronchialis]|uniref:chitosanase n=1 Tax=Peterkaempfera bronchialis TaxID=2126346 RepID=UPI003C2F8498
MSVRRLSTAVAACLLAPTLAGCGWATEGDRTGSGRAADRTAATAGAGAGHTGDAAADLTADQRRTADRLVSVFAHSTTTISYDSVEDHHDGCGFTAGRAGFCTATGDLAEVVRRYADAVPGNPLARYLPQLRALAKRSSADTAPLGPDFVGAWRKAAADDRFRTVQDTAVEDLYYGPALRAARSHGLTSALAVAVFYDTAIQHGTDVDADGLPALIEQADAQAGGRPGEGVTEGAWLTALLSVRRADLLHPHNHDRAVDWPESVGRVDALQQLVTDRQFDLAPPVTVDPWGDEEFTVS